MLYICSYIYVVFVVSDVVVYGASSPAEEGRLGAPVPFIVQEYGWRVRAGLSTEGGLRERRASSSPLITLRG